ncbi:Hypothetical_protein [Hexamita inflata]|uniref:Hypothetical_protein n=1 Tax=Hexamita inflata TaxID=28002 RepID=A0ABP1H1N3_9EUKA
MLHCVTNRYNEAVYKLKLKRLPAVETSFIQKLETLEKPEYNKIHVFVNIQQIKFSLANMLETMVLVIYKLCVISDNCWWLQYHQILQVITLYASKLKIKDAKTQAEVKQHGFEKAITVQLSLAF